MVRLSIMVMTPTSRALLLTVLLLSAVTISTQQRIDCRKYVYAPICRGVAAKRSDGGSMRLLHSVQPSRVAELTEDQNDTYGAPQPSEEPSTAEQSAIDADTIDRLQMMRPHRERKVLRSRSHHQQQPLRFYFPRSVQGALQSDYEY